MNFGSILNIALFEELHNAVERNEINVQRRILRDTSNPFELREEEFRKNFRLSRDLVWYLVQILRPHLKESQRSNSLKPEFKVLSALSFFAMGCYQRSVGNSMHMSVERSTVSKIISEVTDAMVEHVLNIHPFKFPQTEVERQAVKLRFYQKFGFPGVVGAIDCTHIAIIAPKTDDPVRPGLAYYNRKGFYSLNVQMICDANLKILNCNARFPGSTHDSAIWTMSVVNRHLEEKYFNNELNSSWLIGDAGYPLQPWLLTPLEGYPAESPEGRYTRHHIFARNTIERCFGILKQRFRCLLKHRVLHYAPVRAAKIVLSCAILHNLAIDAGLPLEEPKNLDNNEQMECIDNNQVSLNSVSHLNEGRRVQAQLIQRHFT